MLERKEPSQTAFLSGFANSMFQASGTLCGESNWTKAAEKASVPPALQSIQHWNQFEADLDLMAKSGANSYRFSIEWSHIEPTQGFYDEAVLERYAKMIVACHKRGIEPMITLFHFNEPLWFTKLGGFESEENTKYFLNFCLNVFNRFSKNVRLWCTINEPAVFAFSGFLLGQFPPHQRNLQKTLDVLTNLLAAHVEVYTALKQQPHGQEVEIGIVHNPLKFLPRYSYEPIELFVSKFLTNITNDLVMTFLKTGYLKYSLTSSAYKDFYNPHAMNSFDFLGLNFYANAIIGFNKDNFFGATCFPGQVMGDMYLPLDAKGFAAAIDEFAMSGKPVYITETGIADKSDQLRRQFLQEYLAVVKEKRKAGLDIRGLYYWTFADNYEWNEGFTKNFGLFNYTREPRDSIKIYEAFMKENNQSETLEFKRTI